MVIFGPKPWVNPFEKMGIFRLFELLVFIAQKGVFSLYNIVKDIFVAYTAKKKNRPIAIFRAKPWVNIFKKMSIFFDFKTYQYCVKKKVGKMVIFGSKAWVNPF